MNKHLIYPRSGDPNTVYIKNVITRPEITAGVICRCTMTMHRIPVILKSITFYTSTLSIAIS